MTDLTIERANQILTITFNRPRVMNAFTLEMIRDIKRALQEAANDSSTRVVIFAGAGDNFCSGADIRMEQSCTLAEYREFVSTIQDVTLALRNLPAVAIAAIQGYCLGGGMELACACDLRVASTEAQLGFPEVSIGLTITSGASQLLPRLVGVTYAKALTLLGKPIDAAEAYRIGLVNRVVPRAELMPQVLQMAETIKSNAPQAVANQKRLMDVGADAALEGILRYEVETILATFAMADAQEGMRAFIEKRAPKFVGR